MHIEEALIHSCKKNDSNAQKRLYTMLLPYLRAIVNRYLRDTSYEKDALQESFVKIFKTIECYEEQKGALKSWAARITINTCLNLNKRVIGLPTEALESIGHLQPDESKYQLEDRKAVLNKMLKDMPPDFSDVFNLFVIEGYDHHICCQSEWRLPRGRALFDTFYFYRHLYFSLPRIWSFNSKK